ncbi:MAG: T9SS type A sorting domain-containing protein [Prolixibacteraceae bacterium]|nr:T9SS type A sorting domain-containing protein [Prolixibacteraceae bacterium]
MSHLFSSRKLFLISIFVLIILKVQGQFATGVSDYLPAPGQYTNAEFIGTPAAATSLIGTNRGVVSLGAFGGSIVLEFSSGIKNDPNNPYGVDFTVFGNATTTWSEPGIVQVMKDENTNGLPDDTWYEIAGCDHYWNTTISNYEITYKNSGLNSAADIYWTDNQEKSGVISVNSFHLQSYYPQAELFPAVAVEKYILSGTRLKGQIDLSNPGVVNSSRRAFGYADNTPVISASEKLPDNPYTIAIEGSGGDAIDIDWAVDKDGNHVKLDEIHFVRIYTGMNAMVGWLGEVSTEITGIRDVEPAAVNGTRSMVVIQDLPPKIMAGEGIDINAVFFESGIRAENAPISWSINNPELAVIEEGKLKALQNGKVRLRASNSGIYAEKELEIFSAGKALITLTTNSVKVNDRLELTGKLTDQNGNILTGITPKWRIENELVAELIQVDGTHFLKGKQTGKCWLYLESVEIESLLDSVLIQVIPESAMKKVFIAVKTAEKTLVPRHSIWVETIDLTSNVDNAQKSYQLTDTSFVSVAHALAALYKHTELENEWAFRDDAEGGSALYLWRIPENEEGSTAYHFGYGGSRTSAAFRKTWVVMLNQQPFVTGLDKIKVNNNDEILVYQIADNEIPWSVAHLTTGSDSLKLNQTVDLQLMNYFCSMNQNRTVSINSSEVLAYQTVQIELQNSTKSGTTYTTDEFGKLALTIDKAGDYLFVSGIDASKLFVDSATGIKGNLANGLSCKVYPNPFTNWLRIECLTPINSVEIVDFHGRIVYSEGFSQASIDLSHLPAGFYILKVKSGSQVFQQKLIKQ